MINTLIRQNIYAPFLALFIYVSTPEKINMPRFFHALYMPKSKK